MRKSFKTMDIGYSTELEAGLFSGLENNDQYLLDRVNHNTKFLYAYQHTGSMSWSGNDDMSSRKTLHVSPKLIFKNDTVYFGSLRIRTVTCTKISSTFSGGYFNIGVVWETFPDGSYAGWSGGINLETFINTTGYFNGMQSSSYFYVRGGTEDFESSVILFDQSWGVTGETFSGEIDSYTGSPVEFTIQEVGPIRLWL